MIVTAAWRRNNSWGTLIDLLCGYRVITSMENIKVFLITSIEIINIVFLSLSISLSNDLIIYLPVSIFMCICPIYFGNALEYFMKNSDTLH